MMIFLVLWFVFMISYGVGTTSILRPQKVNWKTLKSLVATPYLNAIGTISVTVNQTNRMSFIPRLLSFYLWMFIRQDKILNLNMNYYQWGSWFIRVYRINCNFDHQRRLEEDRTRDAFNAFNHSVIFITPSLAFIPPFYRSVTN